MTPFWSDGQTHIYLGDVLATLREMPDESVHMVCCSPPYWGLRDYGTATWEGGAEGCGHIEIRGGNGEKSAKQVSSAGTQGYAYRDTCGKCGARRIDQQLGLEPTPEAHVAAMVEVFREVRRVLRSDGTAWVNYGDSYANDTKWGGSTGGKHVSALHGDTGIGRQKTVTGLKPKDLVGMPWRVAFALQADGWWLRSDIIWAKPNPMPESVTDRPTKAHEYVFLLTKSARYFYDADAVREEHAEASLARYENGGAGANGKPYAMQQSPRGNPAGRNSRSVWTIATEPYAAAHFATFPTELPRRCILAGTSERGVCSDCGAPWERVTETPQYPKELRAKPGDPGVKVGYGNPEVNTTGSGAKMQAWRNENPPQTVAWRPTCTHEAPTVPAIVLDPFLGSGTTAWVAKTLGRRAVGIELNPEYAALAVKRNQQMAMMETGAAWA